MDNAIYSATPLTRVAPQPLARPVVMSAPPKAAALRPEGHNAFWEGARPWLVLLGATALTTIGAYVIAKDSIDHITGGGGNATDWLVASTSFGLGVLLDAAIVISGMRTHQEKGWWAWLARIMFVLCIGVESMTLAYFYKIIQPESVPASVSTIVDGIHNLLYFFRAGLPPLIVAFFAVAVRNLVFTQADRKRQMKEGTGARLMVLEAKLADPANDEDKATLVREYETQLRLFEYASDASKDEKDANTSLIDQFKRIWDITQTNTKAETALREEVVRLRTQFTTEVQALREQMAHQFGEQIVHLQEQIAELAQGQEDEEDGKPVSMNRSGNLPPVNPAKPTPAERRFPKWVYDQAYDLMRTRQRSETVNLATLADKTGYEARIVGEALRTYRPAVERRLRGNETMADNIVYANPGFYLLDATPAGQ